MAAAFPNKCYALDLSAELQQSFVSKNIFSLCEQSALF